MYNEWLFKIRGSCGYIVFNQCVFLWIVVCFFFFRILNHNNIVVGNNTPYYVLG